MKQKNLSVETLRGLAIILVVIGHVIGYDILGGMKVPEDSSWRHFYFTFSYIRMPLFTVISGWVYSLYPIKSGTGFSFMMKKARRILIPMVVVVSIYFISQVLLPYTSMNESIADIWKVYIFPYSLYWYLPSLILVFIIITILEELNLLKDILSWSIFFLISIAGLLLRDLFLEGSTNYFSYLGAIYLLPFFLLGLAINRFKEVFSNRIFLWIMLILLIVGVLLQQLGWYEVFEYDFYMLKKSGPIGLLVGITSTILLMRIKWNNKILIYIGGFSYTIYLFHVFGVGLTRVVLQKYIGISNNYIIFFVCLTAGVVTPIIIEYIFDRYQLSRLLFLGRKLKKQTK
ncbi:MAG: acyltransferase [candidate division Zixibacteria bacterium]|nr:acyltransferase [candidate division Zixibacteria bacterium]